MSEEKFTFITPSGEEVTISGTKSKIKMAMGVIGEMILNDVDWKEQNIQTLNDIGEYFLNCDKASPEDFATAKKFFEAAEEYKDPQASDRLSCMQDNPLIERAMWLRAADRNAPAPVDSSIEDYKEQAAYWRKKIAEAEGKPFEGDAPTKEELFKYQLKFFDIYKRAFDGDLEAMKICLEFCEEEAAYWNKREP